MTTPNTTPMTYNDYVNQIAVMAVVNVQTVGGLVSGIDAAFNTIIPQMLNYAELRIQRDLDLLPSLTTRSYTMVAGANQVQISANDFVTLQSITLSVNGLPTPLLPVTKEFIQNVCAAPATLGTPKYFAMYGGDVLTGGNTYNNLLFGPSPDSNYGMTVSGTIRLPSLNQTNSAPLASTATTFISANLPDLLLQASLIYISQYQRNFGAASNDPQMGPTYEMQYQNLLKTALVEEARKKFQSTAWASQSPTLIASPSR